MEDLSQQERALDCASQMRRKGMEYRSLGFPLLAAEYLNNARAAERWAVRQVRKKGKLDGSKNLLH